MSEPFLIDDPLDTSDWIEMPRNEVLLKIEQLLTRDLVAFELDFAPESTPIGTLKMFTWIMTTDQGDQEPAFLVVKDPMPDVPDRWFIHQDLILTQESS